MRHVVKVVIILAVTTGSALAQQMARTEVFVAFFAKGVVSVSDPTTENLQTNFTITNPGKSVTGVNFQFFSTDGGLLGLPLQKGPGVVGEPVTTVTNPFEVPAESSVTVSIAHVGFLQTGWIRITSTQPVTVQQGLNWLFILYGAAPVLTASTLASTAVQASEPIRRVAIALTEEPGFTSGLAIVAAVDGISGTLALMDNQTGQRVATRQIRVASHNQWLNFAEQLFPELVTVRSGTIVGEFSGDVLVTSIRMHSASRRLVPNLVTNAR